MGRLIAVTTSRGGAGKTTLVRMLAAKLASTRYRVTVVDADPNQTFQRWHQHAYEGSPFDCVHEPREDEIVHLLHRLVHESDVVLTDCAGFGNRTAALAAGASDLVLIPMMADRDGVIEALKTIKQVASYSALRGHDIPVRVVLSRWRPNGLAERAALEDLDTSRVSRLTQHVSDLTEHIKATYSGTVPLGGRIGGEAASIVGELVALGAVARKPAAKPRRKAEAA